MSDNYVALLDTHASLAEVPSLAASVLGCLCRHGLVIPQLAQECVLEGMGYPAGPKCSDAYADEEGELKFWTLHTSGVEILSTPWVNHFGVTVFETAVCPRCGHEHQEDFLDDQLQTAMDSFESDLTVPMIACHACGVASRIHDWTCVPHLGFVNLAVVFWNWPPFEAPGWRLNVPALISQEIGHPLVESYGHV